MNVQLKDITVTARDGRVSHLDQVYIRGSHVRFFIVPDMLRSVEPPPGLAANIMLFPNHEPGLIGSAITETRRCSEVEV
jgi:hypothetical protein